MHADRDDTPAVDESCSFEHGYWRSSQELGERLSELAGGQIPESEFRLLADNLPTLCWIANGDGYIVWYNRRWHQYCGTAPEEMEGWGWQSVHDPEQLPEVMARWTESIATGEPFEMTFPLRGADGVFRPFLTRIQPVRDSTGKVARWYGVNAEIGATVAAEEALRESEARLRIVQAAGGIGSFDYDLQSDAAICSPEYYSLLGLPDGHPINRTTWTATIHPDDRERALEALDRAIAERKPFDYEYRIIRADNGELRWLAGRAAVIFDDEDRPWRYVGGNIDVTERKRSETLRAAQNHVLELSIGDEPLANTLEELVRSVEEQSTDVLGSILLLDGDGKHLRHGAAPSLPDAYNAAIDGIAIGPGVGSCGTAADAGRPVFVADIANDPLWKDFRDLALEHGLRACWSIPILSGGGEVLGTFAMYYREPREPTPADLELVEFVIRSAALLIERKRAEEALREETRTLETLNRTGAAIAGELDLQKVVQMVTDAGVELSGAQFGAFFYNVLDNRGESYMLYTLSGVDRSHFDKFPMPRNTAVFGPTFDGSGVVRSDDITRDPRYGHNPPYNGMPEGHLPVCSYLAVPVMSRSGEVIGGLFFGHSAPGRFTERHERLLLGVASQAAVSIDNARLYQALQRANETLEQRVEERTAELESANEALRQAQKMEAIGQLTGGIAHDFNNMLTVIRGSTDVLRRSDLDADRRSRYLDAIADTADRAASLTGQLLAFARRQALKAEVFDAAERVRGIGEMLRTVLGSRIALSIEATCPDCFVEVDANQFDAALLNMAVNARDAMDGEGALAIRIESVDRLPARLGGSGEGRFVAVAVADHGHGIAPDALQRLFEPFFTTKDVGKGTGLGLSQVYGFAKQSGGDVLVESTVDVGSTFTMFLPQAASERPAKADERPAASPVPAGARVLIVEDNREVGAFAEQVLGDLGFETTLADSADQARALFDRGESYDVVFSDVVMPGTSGIDFATELRSSHPGLPIVLTSGYSNVLAAESGHGFALLHKPYSLEALSKALEEALARP